MNQPNNSLEKCAEQLIEAVSDVVSACASAGNGVDFASLQNISSEHRINYCELAKDLYRKRRLRSAVFEADDMFGEPAWDIMLDLFVAACENRRISVSSACIGASVPATTALRWVTILETKGWISRKPDKQDARRSHVCLTSLGRSLMTDYLDRTHGLVSQAISLNS